MFADPNTQSIFVPSSIVTPDTSVSVEDVWQKALRGLVSRKDASTALPTNDLSFVTY